MKTAWRKCNFCFGKSSYFKHKLILIFVLIFFKWPTLASFLFIFVLFTWKLYLAINYKRVNTSRNTYCERCRILCLKYTGFLEKCRERIGISKERFRINFVAIFDVLKFVSRLGKDLSIFRRNLRKQCHSRNQGCLIFCCKNHGFYILPKPARADR